MKQRLVPAPWGRRVGPPVAKIVSRVSTYAPALAGRGPRGSGRKTQGSLGWALEEVRPESDGVGASRMTAERRPIGSGCMTLAGKPIRRVAVWAAA
jgi:hypothetical protein